jgi:hypothetical protein
VTPPTTEQSEEQESADIKISHYRSTDDSAGAKQLITELVVKDSDTFKFLERMEEKRLDKPCSENLDMRDKVHGECKRYKYQGRIFYLDDKTLTLYKTLMMDARGVFTRRIFETIHDAEHTFRGQKRAQLAAKNKFNKSEKGVSVTKNRARKTNDEGVVQHHQSSFFEPERIFFGHFFRRQERRLNYATKVKIVSEMGVFFGNTKNLSLGGAYLVVNDIVFLKPNEIVTVEFTRLKEEHHESGVSDVFFQLLEFVHKESRTYIHLQLDDDENKIAFKSFVRNLVSQYSYRYKFDVEDDYQTHVSLLLEKLYCENSSQIPIFIGQTKKGINHLQVVCQNQGNGRLVNFFRRESGFDFSPLSLPHRLGDILSQPDLMIAMCRGGESAIFKIYSLSAYEAASTDDWDNFVRYALTQVEYRIVKIVGITDSFSDGESKKAKSINDQFSELSDAVFEKFINKLDELQFFGMIVDVTSQCEVKYQASWFQNKRLPNVADISYWYGRKFYEAEKPKKSSDKLFKPQYVELAYRANRDEERYIVDMAVELKTDQGKIAGQSVNFSSHGFCVDVPSVLVGLYVQDKITIGLPTLQKKRSKVDLSDVPYTVVKLTKNEVDNKTTVMLHRHYEGRTRLVDDFFTELVETNKTNLVTCNLDFQNEFMSRTYEKICGENVQAIPLFLSRSESGSIVFNSFAVAETLNDLAAFFQVEEDVLDLSCMNRYAVSATIYEQIVKISRKSERTQFRAEPFEMVYYLGKYYAEGLGKNIISAVAECEFISEDAKKNMWMAC